jgi:quinol-cytochrome oxidoreductase complex cytochrome b subunit
MILNILVIIIILYIIVKLVEYIQRNKIRNVKTGEMIKGNSSVYIFYYILKSFFVNQSTIFEESKEAFPELKKEKIFNSYINFKLILVILLHKKIGSERL